MQGWALASTAPKPTRKRKAQANTHTYTNPRPYTQAREHTHKTNPPTCAQTPAKASGKSKKKVQSAAAHTHNNTHTRRRTHTIPTHAYLPICTQQTKATKSGAPQTQVQTNAAPRVTALGHAPTHANRIIGSVADGYVLTRGVVPADLREKAQRVAYDHKTVWGPMVGAFRSILYATREHTQDIRAHGEAACLLPFRGAAKDVYRGFSECVLASATEVGIPFGSIAEMELIRTPSKSTGQARHMDTICGVWAAVSPLGSTAPAPTLVMDYPYMDWPALLDAASPLHGSWESFPELALRWSLGDILFFRTNRLHAGPPNTTDQDRVILFAAGTPPSGHSLHGPESLDRGMVPAD